MSNLILGDGLLGKELYKQTGWDYVSRKKTGFDITKPETFLNNLTDVYDGCDVAIKYTAIINCIACTDTYSNNKESHWNTNYVGVDNLIKFCNKWNIKLIHISTDYIYAYSKDDASELDVPVHCKNWYAYTKLLADGYIQLKSKKYLLIRSTHKEEPFKHETAWINQVGNFDYVSKISSLMITLIDNNAYGVYNVGTELKTMYDLAKMTKDTVIPVNKRFHSTMPSDVTINLDKLKKFYDKE